MKVSLIGLLIGLVRVRVQSRMRSYFEDPIKVRITV